MSEFAGYFFDIFKEDIAIVQNGKSLYQDKALVNNDELNDSLSEMKNSHASEATSLFVYHNANVEYTSEGAMSCIQHAEVAWSLPANWRQSSCLLYKVKYLVQYHMQGSHFQLNKLDNLTTLTHNNEFPIAGGLFKGDYGTDAHGVEFIQLRLPQKGAKGRLYSFAQ